MLRHLLTAGRVAAATIVLMSCSNGPSSDRDSQQAGTTTIVEETTTTATYTAEEQWCIDQVDRLDELADTDTNPDPAEALAQLEAFAASLIDTDPTGTVAKHAPAARDQLAGYLDEIADMTAADAIKHLATIDITGTALGDLAVALAECDPTSALHAEPLPDPEPGDDPATDDDGEPSDTNDDP